MALPYKMNLKDKLPVSYLLFTTRGRINRAAYWLASIFVWTTFYVLFNVLQFVFSYAATWVLYPLLFLALFATAAKRLHDTNRSANWLWLIIIPVFGPLVLMYLLGIKKGSYQANKYGAVPGSAPDYFKNADATVIPHLKTGERIVNDVTQLNPVLVQNVIAPVSGKELQDVLKNTPGPVSIGGGRFSMGGQTASHASTHIDMRRMNKVLEFSQKDRLIKVQAGMRWCDIQHYVDPYNLSVKIMQTYANFTVGGALSVNCHGRYIGLGPVILSVKSIDIVLANGELRHASRLENAELFFACIGCYNAVGVIAAAELELEENVAVKRVTKKMPVEDYLNYFFTSIRENKDVVFHNGDIYTPAYKNVRAVSWIKTQKKPTVKTRLMPLAASYPVERYFINAFSKNNFGKWRREYIIDPIVYAGKKIHWRNYEAGYDVAELEPLSRKNSTYVLQEYFVPVSNFDAFVPLMARVFNKHKVNVLNVSVRHAKADDGCLLAWARGEVFAFVVYYKQGTDDAAKNAVAEWTREMIDGVLSVDGSYYLPYQVHATKQQFYKAYPNAGRLFELKKKLDPEYKFRNVLWDTYYST